MPWFVDAVVDALVRIDARDAVADRDVDAARSVGRGPNRRARSPAGHLNRAEPCARWQVRQPM